MTNTVINNNTICTSTYNGRQVDWQTTVIDNHGELRWWTMMTGHNVRHLGMMTRAHLWPTGLLSFYIIHYNSENLPIKAVRFGKGRSRRRHSESQDTDRGKPCQAAK